MSLALRRAVGTETSDSFVVPCGLEEFILRNSLCHDNSSRYSDAISALLLLAPRPVVVLNAQTPNYLRLELLKNQMLGRDSEKWQNGFRCLEAAGAP